MIQKIGKQGGRVGSFRFQNILTGGALYSLQFGLSGITGTQSSRVVSYGNFNSPLLVVPDFSKVIVYVEKAAADFGRSGSRRYQTRVQIFPVYTNAPNVAFVSEVGSFTSGFDCLDPSVRSKVNIRNKGLFEFEGDSVNDYLLLRALFDSIDSSGTTSLCSPQKSAFSVAVFVPGVSDSEIVKNPASNVDYFRRILINDL